VHKLQALRGKKNINLGADFFAAAIFLDRVDVAQLTMKKKRRDFLRLTGLTGMGIASTGIIKGFSAGLNSSSSIPDLNNFSNVKNENFYTEEISLIGQYGQWAASLTENKLPLLSFRNPGWKDLEKWRNVARNRLIERMAIPDLGPTPKVTIIKQTDYDGLHIEEIRWQLPYGRPTEAILLKPQNAKGKIPGILAFHDHGGNKYFGTRKITRTSEQRHPLIETHQKEYYEGVAWANEIAKRGYVVLVPDAFPFASRRVMIQDVPDFMREGLNDNEPENPDHIHAYNNSVFSLLKTG
jgi:hypothetical protein